MQSVKCVVVGDSESGYSEYPRYSPKTNLLLSFTNNTPPSQWMHNVFDNYSKEVNVGGVPVNLGLWDISDHVDYKELRSLSYPMTDIFLVCFSVVVPSSFENAREWVNEITKHSNAPYLVIGLETELRHHPTDQKQVTRKQGEGLASILGATRYMECSAHTRKGVADVFDIAVVLALETDETLTKSTKELFEESLKYGYVESHSIISLLMGSAGVGKTHTKHIIFGKLPPPIRHSTHLAERPVRAVRVSITGEEWHEVDNEEHDRILANAMAIGLPREFTLSVLRRRIAERLSPSLARPRSSSVGSAVVSKRPSSLDALPQSSRTMTIALPQSSHAMPAASQTSFAALRQAWEREVEKLIKLIRTSSGLVSKQFLLKQDWVYLIDSGGQRQFHEILPAFLPHTSVSIFVLKLSEMLSQFPSNEYYVDGEPVGTACTSNLTNEEVLKQCIQTIQSQQTNLETKVVVVGTHRDLEKECPETREQKNGKLLSMLSPAFDKSLVFFGQQLNEVIFPINAKTPEPEDHEVAKELRTVILKAASGKKRKKTPVSWYVLDQIIHRMATALHRKILTREECLLIAHWLHISEKTFDVAIDHLVSISALHYYRHLLPNVMFTDPQVLLDKVTELVEFHRQLSNNPSGQRAASGEFRRFRDEAHVSIKLLSLEQFNRHYSDIFTPKCFLKLMEDRLIIVRQIGKDEYFMPCVLPVLTSEVVDTHRIRSSVPAAPLIIRFPNGWAPHGIFCSLIAYLLSFQNPSPWKLYPDPNNPMEPKCLARNCITFQLPDAPGAVTLIDSFAFFEVHVKAPDAVCKVICYIVQTAIILGLQKAADTLRYKDLSPELAFICQHRVTDVNSASNAKDGSHPKIHAAKILRKHKWWKCTLNPGIYGDLKDEHDIWFTAPLNVGKTKPAKRTDHGKHHSFMRQSGYHPGKQCHESPKTTHRRGDTSATEGEQPNLPELIRFQGRDRRINIPQEIGTNFVNFGILLLDDKNGTRILSITQECKDKAEEINTRVLQLWLGGKGKIPVSWHTLVEVLEDIELGALADEIAFMKCSNLTF